MKIDDGFDGSVAGASEIERKMIKWCAGLNKFMSGIKEMHEAEFATY